MSKNILAILFFYCISWGQSPWNSPFLNRSVTTNEYSSIGYYSTTPIKILITRPVTKYGDIPLENKWILLLCENHLYFRLLGIEAITVVSPEELIELVPEYMEFKKPIPVDKYLEAAKKLSVDYLIYIQCEYNRFISEGQVNIGKDTDVTFFGKVVSPFRDKPVFAEGKQFPVKKLGMRLDTFLTQLFQVLNITITDKNRNFMETAILPTRTGRVKKLGEYLALAYDSKFENWKIFFKHYKRFVTKDSDMVLGYYAGANMCEMSGKYLDGAHLYHTLMENMDLSYPRAFVETCRLYRLSGEYDQAEKILASLPPVIQFKHDLAMEKAFLLENRGELQKAATITRDVLNEDKNNKKALEFYKQNNLSEFDTSSDSLQDSPTVNTGSKR